MRNYPANRRPRKANKYCCLCGQNNNLADIYGFEEVLRDLRIEGTHAHPMCVLDEQAKRKRQLKRCG